MHPPPRFAVLLCLGMVAGCAVGPDYSKSRVELPEHFSAQTSKARQPGAANDDLAAWWNAFNDPILSQLINRALEQNLDLAQANARIEQARAGLGAANAALLPSATVNGQAARARQSLETPLGQVLNSDPSYNRYGSAYEANLNAGWELDVFGGLRRGKEAAFADYQASQAGAIATRLAVVAQTADLYMPWPLTASPFCGPAKMWKALFRHGSTASNNRPSSPKASRRMRKPERHRLPPMKKAWSA
ncbi:hypothetical protein PS838_03189 [Pseudomonas fluorescens]|nr:hypothetical protein PS838_03189 [Pseudomonas fluorescens]